MDFDTIYKEFAPGIFRICMGYTNDYEGAKDLTQETFIAVWQHLPSFRNESKLSTWIYRIATNNCLRAVERAARTATTDLPPGLPLPPEERREEKLQFLYHCIAALEEGDRIIISLVLEDLPQAEIAAIVGLSHTNIRVKVHRIKEKLAQKFRQHGPFE